MKFHFIFAPKKYTSTLQGFEANSEAITRVPHTHIEKFKTTGLDYT